MLTILFGSLSVSCGLILYALILLHASFDANQFGFYLTLLVALVAAASNIKAAVAHFKMTGGGETLPRIPLRPFLFVALTLFLAGRLFDGL